MYIYIYIYRIAHKVYSIQCIVQEPGGGRGEAQRVRQRPLGCAWLLWGRKMYPLLFGVFGLGALGRVGF